MENNEQCRLSTVLPNSYTIMQYNFLPFPYISCIQVIPPVMPFSNQTGTSWYGISHKHTRTHKEREKWNLSILSLTIILLSLAIRKLFTWLTQFSSVAQLCPTLCDPMNCSTPGLPVHHQLPEFTQTHVHRVGDAIQPSHPLSSPSPPAPNPSQHQSPFQWVNSSHEVAKVLEFQL